VRVAFTTAALVMPTAAPRWARADDVAAECADAANAGQPLRREGRLREAREQFVLCARDACPPVVREHCAPWIREIDAATPSVVVRARDAHGVDVSGARVWVDGQPLDRIPGIASAVDPGVRRFRVAAPDGVVWEEDVVVAQGEKNRVVVVTLPARPGEAAVGGEHTAAPAAPAPIVSPVVAYALGGVGIGALGAFGLLEKKAHDDDDALRSGCAVTRTCVPSELAAVRTESTVAIVAGAFGVVSLAASIVFLLWRTEPPKRSGAGAGAFQPVLSAGGLSCRFGM
jgi:hypothetical protein